MYILLLLLLDVGCWAVVIVAFLVIPKGKLCVIRTNTMRNGILRRHRIGWKGTCGKRKSIPGYNPLAFYIYIYTPFILRGRLKESAYHQYQEGKWKWKRGEPRYKQQNAHKYFVGKRTREKVFAGVAFTISFCSVRFGSVKNLKCYIFFMAIINA